MGAFTHSRGLRWVAARFLSGTAITVVVIAVLVLVGRPCRFQAVYSGLIWGGAIGPAMSAALFFHLRHREWARTLVRFLWVGVVSMFAALIVVPNTLGAIQRAARVKAMADMREIGRKLDTGVTPELTLDPWGTPYLIEATSTGYTIISRGECGEVDDPPWSSFPDGPTSSPESDLVFSNGRFLRYPGGESP